MSSGIKLYGSILKVLKDENNNQYHHNQHQQQTNNNNNNNNKTINCPALVNKEQNICFFFSRKGFCRNGDDCRYIHGCLCDICNKAMLIPDNIEQNQTHYIECLLNQENQVLRQNESMRQYECEICFESIVDSGKKFGLLSHCQHKFCLDCIRSWRYSATNSGSSGSGGIINSNIINNGSTIFFSTNPNNDGSFDIFNSIRIFNNNQQLRNHEQIQHVRKCPTCRMVSYFIIPSDIYVDGDDKEQMINIYKMKLSTIPCKYFENQGYCKFGLNCMYSHSNQQFIEDFESDLTNSIPNNNNYYNNLLTTSTTTTTTTTIPSNSTGDDDDVNDDDDDDDDDNQINFNFNINDESNYSD
ncbi:hypothetical protein RB653_007651 [Dictyostelium firmibasis]|uniref:RING-type E3 ubiquitin transferase n=1 Tax=Dictyostelium firmibasis TaxID=79012 RepID=A0AAN7TUT4_9MYCE